MCTASDMIALIERIDVYVSSRTGTNHVIAMQISRQLALFTLCSARFFLFCLLPFRFAHLSRNTLSTLVSIYFPSKHIVFTHNRTLSYHSPRVGGTACDKIPWYITFIYVLFVHSLCVRVYVHIEIRLRSHSIDLNQCV